MRSEALLGQCGPLGAGAAVVGVGVDGDAAAGSEETGDLNVLGVHELNQVLHDGVDNILVEITVAAEAEQIQLQRLAFHHAYIRNVRNPDFRKVRLAGDGAQGGELRAIETYPVVVLRMLVFKGFQYFRSVVLAILGLVSKGFQ